MFLWKNKKNINNFWLKKKKAPYLEICSSEYPQCTLFSVKPSAISHVETACYFAYARKALFQARINYTKNRSTCPGVASL